MLRHFFGVCVAAKICTTTAHNSEQWHAKQTQPEPVTPSCYMLSAKPLFKWADLAHDQRQASRQLCLHNQTSYKTANVT